MKPLPSLPSLKAFEAAARLGSFQAAAASINVSPTAISHHIRGLEAALNVKLFSRSARQVRLTDEGQTLSDGVSKAFRILETSVNAVADKGAQSKVRIAMGPSIASRWLMPRFAAFCEAFPETVLELVQTPLLVSPQNVDADIFITWGDGSIPGMVSDPLIRVKAAPVASPDFLKKHGHPTAPHDLQGYPLVHQRDTLGWNAWFLHHGIHLDTPLTGSVIEDTNVVLQAALAGQGVVMGWLPLINEELRAGRLVQLYAAIPSENRAYYLVRRKSPSNASLTREICDWLLEQAQILGRSAEP
ncbi:LysR substrate-binding domain-containing protein [Halocynthiibacter namhaensis]|uniref:LysR substrate-binding domain-containing protein n=1 Tax=Halocynthiibacter namhaensis TaxID=1290553 RepID=UPI00068EC281|nr:LysR substrate-binding domain-containing protein [Halocynthiibacter namhaensis]